MGWEDPLDRRMTTHSSLLAWRIPWIEEPGGLQSMGHKESDTTKRLSSLLAQISPSRASHVSVSDGFTYATSSYKITFPPGPSMSFTLQRPALKHALHEASHHCQSDLCIPFSQLLLQSLMPLLWALDT